jgi:ferredoxin
MAYVVTDQCINSGSCVPECPVDAFRQADDQVVIDPDLCTHCGDCEQVCPVEAIFDLKNVPKDQQTKIAFNREQSKIKPRIR